MVRNHALGYLIYKFFYRIFEFLRHWYVKSTRIYWHFVFNQLENLDRLLAFKTTIKYWLEPLYGDYSIIGYVLGFFFRTSRIIMGAITYSIIMLIAIIAYLVWILFPLLLIYGAITGESIHEYY